MTDHNKQSQEVGSGRKPWPLCVSFKQLGRIRVYEEEEKEKGQIHMHGRKMIRKGGEKKTPKSQMDASGKGTISAILHK